mmetsp:Transcript_117990/g.313938  ORF Transcript_117990/g.313938 Transcript_117990/m.313938 type:complete len:274 (+) Transcript_117990:664-1485(+)
MPPALSRQKRGRSAPKIERQKTEVSSASAVWRLRKGAAAHWGSLAMTASMTPRTTAAKAMTPRNIMRSVLLRHHWMRRRWSRTWNCDAQLRRPRMMLPDLVRAGFTMTSDAESMEESLSLALESSSISRITASCRRSRYSRNSGFVTTSASRPAISAKSVSTTSSSGFPPWRRESSLSSSPSSTTPLPSASMTFHSSSSAPDSAARSSMMVQRRTRLEPTCALGQKSRCSQRSKSIWGWNLGSLRFSTSPEITSMNQSAGFSSSGISKPSCSK